MTAYELGVDVSKWQVPEKVDWRKLYEVDGVRFMVARYAYGNLVDATFWKHGWFALQQGGIEISAYQFLVADHNAAQQATLALQIAHLLQTPFVIDIEGKGLTKKHIDIWMETFMRSGLKPMVYCSQSSWKECYGIEAHPYGDLPLWVANYTTAPSPAMPKGWNTFRSWQYTSNGRLSGYKGAIDLNRRISK